MKHTRELNLELGWPTVDQALRRLDAELEAARKMNTPLMKLIHGYGSSGKGGRIRTASRRYLEMEDKPDKPTYDQILSDIKQRDYNDTHRAAAPLRPADDAIMIDNTDMDFAASLELLLDVIRGRVAS